MAEGCYELTRQAASADASTRASRCEEGQWQSSSCRTEAINCNCNCSTAPDDLISMD